MTLLEGRVVLVTGGGRGLGRAHSLQLARQGATVVVNDAAVALDGAASGDSPGATTPAQDVVAEIEAAGGAAMADGTSVCDWHGVAALVARIVDRFGRVDA